MARECGRVGRSIHLEVHPLRSYRVVLLFCGVVLETIRVFVRCSCTVCRCGCGEVVWHGGGEFGRAAEKKIVVCEPEETFASRSCSARLTPGLTLFHFSDSCFVIHCRSELNKSVLYGSPCLVPHLRWSCFAFAVGVYCSSLLVVELREQTVCWLLIALLTQSAPCAAVLNCVECLFEIHGYDPKWLVPLGDSLSELKVNTWSVAE